MPLKWDQLKRGGWKIENALWQSMPSGWKVLATTSYFIDCEAEVVFFVISEISVCEIVEVDLKGSSRSLLSSLSLCPVGFE